jgi:ribosomal protein L37AE/L43A
MQSVHCNTCGNKIEVPSTVRYITCARCGASLVVRNEGGAWFTETPLAPRRATDLGEVAGRLEELERQSAIARLDREWEIERDSYMMTGRFGARYTPSIATAVLTGVIALVGGGLWTAFTFSIVSSNPLADRGPGRIFPLFGILFMLVGVAIAIYQFSRASQYQQALERYQRRRHQMLDDDPLDKGPGC